MLNKAAYEEYTELILKHYGFKPKVEDIQSQADALVNFVQKMLEKDKQEGELNHDSN